MAAPRISASSYSNTAPLIWSFLYGANRGHYELILDNAPARSAQLLAEGRVDAALAPVISYQAGGNLSLIPEVCVGAEGEVKSVCLATNGKDLDQVKSVSLDVSSKTSVGLTKIVFREFLGFEPKWADSKPDLDRMLEESDCGLLIGDPALTIDESRYRKFDLGGLWHKYTGLGFIFAMWMANPGRAQAAGKIDFSAAKNEGLLHIEEIISNYEPEIPLSRQEFRSYLAKNISYAASAPMQKGLELYFALAAKHGLIERNQPLRYI